MTDHKVTPKKLDPEFVHVLRHEDPDAMRAAFRHALASLARVRSKEVIAIKPNLGSPFPDHTGATTALWMIEETVAYVRRKRGRPVIVEAPSHIHDYQQVLELTGAGELFRRLEVDHVDARTDCIALRPLKYDDSNGPVYHVHHGALGADGMICLPKLKTHNRTGVTLGMKGLMGLLSVPDRHKFHRRGVERDVVELYRRLDDRIRATFIDGIVAMEGHGPTHGKPVAMNVIIAGCDTVSVDAVGALIMGFEPEEVEHIRRAHDAGIGDRKRDWRMEPAGLPLPMRPFERAREDNGLRTQFITIPAVSKVLRMTGMGVRGRTKPILTGPITPNACECAAQCPSGAIDENHQIDLKRCTGSGLCVHTCAQGAVRAEGKRHKWARIVRDLTGL
jgi:uncharacterized protein (DUF362 family)/Pyruvate/2-oxoacid:ferredoxin oxidoreductase delta subunit